jgi:hypothetical protein
MTEWIAKARLERAFQAPAVPRSTSSTAETICWTENGLGGNACWECRFPAAFPRHSRT